MRPVARDDGAAQTAALFAMGEAEDREASAAKNGDELLEFVREDAKDGANDFGAGMLTDDAGPRKKKGKAG